MLARDLIAALTLLVLDNEDGEVLIDTGRELRRIEDVDLGASDEGIIIWAGDAVVE